MNVSTMYEELVKEFDEEDRPTDGAQGNEDCVLSAGKISHYRITRIA